MNPDTIDPIVRISSALFFLLVNALLVAGEFSVIKLRLSHFNPDYMERLKRRKLVGSMLNNADVTLRRARFGIILCTFGYAVIAYPLLLSLFQELGWLAYWLSVTLSFLLAMSVHYLVGELIPRKLAVAHPLKGLQAAAWAVKPVGLLIGPVIRPLRALARLMLKPFGADLSSELEALDIEEQLRALKKESEVSQVPLNVIKNAMEMRELKVQDIILPRNQVQYMDVNAPIEENLELLEVSQHTRFPLCDSDLDNCIGLIHIKDLFRLRKAMDTIDLQEIKREIIRVDPQDALEDALQELLVSRTHMALVADEFGGTVGVITLELILEQLVGEIQDEFDTEEVLIKHVRPAEYVVSGLTSIRGLEETLDIEVENEKDVATVSGLITSELGRIPDAGEHISLDNLDITVTDVDEKRVISARVRVVDDSEEQIPDS